MGASAPRICWEARNLEAPILSVLCIPLIQLQNCENERTSMWKNCYKYGPSDCDCKPENIKGCDATGITVGGVTCGREINCSLLKHRFQVDINGKFCHLGTCSRECVCPLGN
ncbi:13343_t:CDS:2, partial [Rhizophagus irregularis]